MAKNQNSLLNEDIIDYSFLADMYEDDYFPNHCVDKLRDALIDFCASLEKNNPEDLDELYSLGAQVTEEINSIQDYFQDHNSEFESVAKDNIVEDFGFILDSYGFEDADINILLKNRNW